MSNESADPNTQLLHHGQKLIASSIAALAGVVAVGIYLWRSDSTSRRLGGNNVKESRLLNVKTHQRN